VQNTRIDDTLSFIPKQKRFWAYHIGVLGIVSFIQVIIIYYREHLTEFNLVSYSLWMLFFTVSMLGFRWIYKRFGWDKIRTIKQIPCVIAASMLASLFIVVMMFSPVLPFYLDNILEVQRQFDPQATLVGLTVVLVVTNFLQSMLFSLIWAFIYISESFWKRVKEADLRALRYENSLKEAQLSNLNSQINPHFLFNALNNIRFLIHENADHADEALTTLSEILRHSLKTNLAEKIALYQEVELVEKYLSIAKLQLEARLLTNFHIQKSLDTCLVPPLLLQMLVENAIKHGIEQIQDQGTLTVDISSNNGRLNIHVLNDKPEERDVLASNLGIGLENIKSRLKLMYNDDAVIALHNGDTSFSVNICIPVEYSA
jgi:sensor histidine kinase YesM